MTTRMHSPIGSRTISTTRISSPAERATIERTHRGLRRVPDDARRSCAPCRAHAPSLLGHCVRRRTSGRASRIGLARADAVLPFAAGRAAALLVHAAAARRRRPRADGALGRHGLAVARIGDERTNLPPVAAQSPGSVQPEPADERRTDGELRGHALRRGDRGSRESAGRRIAAARSGDGPDPRGESACDRSRDRAIAARRCAPIPRTCI